VPKLGSDNVGIIHVITDNRTDAHCTGPGDQDSAAALSDDGSFHVGNKLGLVVLADHVSPGSQPEYLIK
jgi:hypothetical protein